MHKIVSKIRYLFLLLEVSASVPNTGAKKLPISIETPLASPHIRSPKFWPYFASGAMIFIKNTGNTTVIIITAKEVFAKS